MHQLWKLRPVRPVDTVHRPDGKERREYQQRVVAEGGTAELSLPLAFNDAPEPGRGGPGGATGATGKAALRVTGSSGWERLSQKAEG